MRPSNWLGLAVFALCSDLVLAPSMGWRLAGWPVVAAIVFVVIAVLACLYLEALNGCQCDSCTEHRRVIWERLNPRQRGGRP